MWWQYLYALDLRSLDNHEQRPMSTSYSIQVQLPRQLCLCYATVQQLLRAERTDLHARSTSTRGDLLRQQLREWRHALLVR
jgi:hypothetical protein